MSEPTQLPVVKTHNRKLERRAIEKINEVIDSLLEDGLTKTWISALLQEAAIKIDE